MVAAISSNAADPAQRLATRLQVGLGGQADAVRSGLFEQILSLPVPLDLDHRQPQPPPDSESLDSQSGQGIVPADSKSDDEPPVNPEADVEEDAAEAYQAVILVDASLPSADASQPEDTSPEPELELHAEQTAPSDSPLRRSELDPSSQPAKADANESVEVAPTPVQSEDALPAANSEKQNPVAQTAAESSERESRRTRQQPEPANQDNAQPHTAPIQVVAEDKPDATEASPASDPADASPQPTTLADVARDRDSNGKRHSQREKWYEQGPSPTTSAERARDAVGNHKPSLPHTIDESAGANPATAAANGDELRSPLGTVNTNVETTADGASAVSATVAAATKFVSANPSGPASPEPSAMSAERSGNLSTGSTTATKSSTSSKHEAAPERAADLSQQERVRLVQRISRSFARLGPMGGNVNIRLHPPQLGSLNVQVRLEGRSMTAKLTTESAAARDAILESLPVLRSRLAEQGFEIAQFQVDVADNNADAATGGNQQQTAFDQSGGGGRWRTQVDYRRFAGNAPPSVDLAAENGPLASPLAWDTTVGIDINA